MPDRTEKLLDAVLPHVPFEGMNDRALVAGAALVVTVDTLIAHLAGTLGRPTWLLLKDGADWRWPGEGERTPWYPSVRIFRQHRPGDWAGVVARVARALDGNVLDGRALDGHAPHGQPAAPALDARPGPGDTAP